MNAVTGLAIRYNNRSVLENMHACRASCLLEGLEERGCGRRGSNSSRDTDGGNHAGRDAGGIAGSMTKEQCKMLRRSVAGAILRAAGAVRPGVEDVVMGHLEENFGYWTEQKEVQN